jgi:hypothetical protein
MLTFFEVQTLEDWIVPANLAIRSASKVDGAVTKEENKSYLLMLFVIFIFVTTFFILNIFITILISSF